MREESITLVPGSSSACVPYCMWHKLRRSLGMRLGGIIPVVHPASHETRSHSEVPSCACTDSSPYQTLVPTLPSSFTCFQLCIIPLFMVHNLEHTVCAILTPEHYIEHTVCAILTPKHCIEHTVCAILTPEHYIEHTYVPYSLLSTILNIPYVPSSLLSTILNIHMCHPHS